MSWCDEFYDSVADGVIEIYAGDQWKTFMIAEKFDRYRVRMRSLSQDLAMHLDYQFGFWVLQRKEMILANSVESIWCRQDWQEFLDTKGHGLL